MTFVLVALIVTVNLVLVAGILGRDFPEPLRAGLTDLTWEGDDAVIVPTIYNDGAVPIELLAISVTGVDDWRVVRSGDDQIHDPARERPIAGEKVRPGDFFWPVIVAEDQCPTVPDLKTIEVRMRVDGREVTQVLRMPAFVADACR